MYTFTSFHLFSTKFSISPYFLFSLNLFVRDGSDEDPDYQAPHVYEVLTPDGQELDITFGGGSHIDKTEGETEGMQTDKSMDALKVSVDNQELTNDEVENIEGKVNNTTLEQDIATSNVEELARVMETVKNINAKNGIVSR